MRQEFADVLIALCGQSFEYVFEVGVRIVSVDFGGLDQTGDGGSALVGLIMCHRRGRLETLPYALGWHDAQQLINTATGSTEDDVRDRAILLLLAIYGLRRGEVAALRLEDIDCEQGHLRVWRLKRHQPQIYPLVSSVEQALTSYIETVRPSVAHAQAFIRTRSPRVPITPPGIYDVVNRRLRSLGVQAAHLAPTRCVMPAHRRCSPTD